jgi:hypothetical protein
VLRSVNRRVHTKIQAAERPEQSWWRFEAVVSQSTRREESSCSGHRGFGGLEGLGLGTPVVSYAPRPISQAVEDFGEFIIEDLSSSCQRRVFALRQPGETRVLYVRAARSLLSDRRLNVPCV